MLYWVNYIVLKKAEIIFRPQCSAMEKAAAAPISHFYSWCSSLLVKDRYLAAVM